MIPESWRLQGRHSMPTLRSAPAAQQRLNSQTDMYIDM